MKTFAFACVLALFSMGLVGCGGETEDVSEETSAPAEETVDVSEEAPTVVEESPAIAEATPLAVEEPPVVAEEAASTDDLLVAQGREVCESQNCLSCHSADGSDLQGPTFKAMYSGEQTVSLDGFPACMPGTLSEEESVATIAFIKSLS